MERLTKRYKGGIAYAEERDIECGSYCDNCGKTDCETVRNMIRKLADYEDAEEQGLLLRLPCKEVYDNSGGYIWYIYLGEIIQCVQCSASFGADGVLYISLVYDEKIFPYREPIAEFDTDPTDWCVNFTDVPINEVGKTLFFTREAAEQALKEMEPIKIDKFPF